MRLCTPQTHLDRTFSTEFFSPRSAHRNTMHSAIVALLVGLKVNLGFFLAKASGRGRNYQSFHAIYDKFQLSLCVYKFHVVLTITTQDSSTWELDIFSIASIPASVASAAFQLASQTLNGMQEKRLRKLQEQLPGLRVDGFPVLFGCRRYLKAGAWSFVIGKICMLTVNP